MQRILNRIALVAVLNLGVLAQPVVLPTPGGNNKRAVKVEPAEKVDNAVAIVLDATGDCLVSNDGQNFRPLKKTAELGENVTIRTGSGASADVFLKRIGSTIRVKPNTEVFFTRTAKNKALNATLDVRKGQVLTVVHKTVLGSSLAIKNAAGKSLNDAVAGGRYIVSADTIEKASPSNDFDEKKTTAIKEQMDIDEVRALSESWNGSENPGLQP